jgi:hypothetical protein
LFGQKQFILVTALIEQDTHCWTIRSSSGAATVSDVTSETTASCNKAVTTVKLTRSAKTIFIVSEILKKFVIDPRKVRPESTKVNNKHNENEMFEKMQKVSARKSDS